MFSLVQKFVLVLDPSLASLGDGLPCRVGSQRDEAKRQAFSPAQDLNSGPVPGIPMVNSWTRLKSDVKQLDSKRIMLATTTHNLATLIFHYMNEGPKSEMQLSTEATRSGNYTTRSYPGFGGKQSLTCSPAAA